jgi:hypothetical protein
MSRRKGEKRIGGGGGPGRSRGLVIPVDFPSISKGLSESPPRGPLFTPNASVRTSPGACWLKEDRRTIEGLGPSERLTITARKSHVTMTGKNSSYKVGTGHAPCGEPGVAPPRSDDGRAAGQSPPSPRPGPKVVLLRGRSGPGPSGEKPGASDLRLDLQAPIDSLRSIRGDLELYYWERPGHGEQRERERYQVSLWIRQVSERTAALEAILLHMGSSSVVLTGVDAAEREALGSSAKLLARWIGDEEPFEQVLRTVAGILHAADVICLGAAGGRAEPGVGRPRTP